MPADQHLTDLIYGASQQAFHEWRESNPNERVFAFALSTLDDAIYVSASLNTDESNKRRLKERQLDPSSAYGLDTKWGPWEWENEYIGQSYFEVVDECLKEMYEKSSENDTFAEFRTTVFESMIQALVRLREHSIISNEHDPREIVMFATVYDSFSAEEIHRKSSDLLNSPEATSELLAVIGG